jgi:hypothetical protein
MLRCGDNRNGEHLIDEHLIGEQLISEHLNGGQRNGDFPESPSKKLLCSQAVLPNSAIKQCSQAALPSSARKQWFCTQNQICLQSVTILFCNQLFGREFWCPIARSSSCALDRRRHP